MIGELNNFFSLPRPPFLSFSIALSLRRSVLPFCELSVKLLRSEANIIITETNKNYKPSPATRKNYIQPTT